MVVLTTPEALKTALPNVTGPLIRIFGDRFNWNVKVAILNTLALLLKKVSVSSVLYKTFSCYHEWAIPRSLDPSKPRSLEASIPRTLNPSKPRSLEASIPRSLDPSKPRSFEASIPRSLDPPISRSFEASIPWSLDPSKPWSTSAHWLSSHFLISKSVIELNFDPYLHLPCSYVCRRQSVFDEKR